MKKLYEKMVQEEEEVNVKKMESNKKLNEEIIVYNVDAEVIRERKKDEIKEEDRKIAE